MFISMSELFDEDTENNLWSRYFDENYKTYYYVNNMTGISQWEKPVSIQFDEVDDHIEFETHETDCFAPEPNMISEFDTNSVAEVESFFTSEAVDPNAVMTYSYYPKKVQKQSLGYAEEIENTVSGQFWSDSKSDSKRSEDQGLVESGDGCDLFDYYEQEEEKEWAAGDKFGVEYNENEEDDSKANVLCSDDLDETAADNSRLHCHRSRPDTTTAVVAPGKTQQDYLNLARMYRLERPYSDPGYKALCVLCHRNYAGDVFFPCQHRCVCRECIVKENICDDRAILEQPDGYCNCSLCAAVIKLILPNEGGAEVEKYWQWVYEEPVQLPPRFLRDFRHTAAALQAVYVDKQGISDGKGTRSGVCKMS